MTRYQVISIPVDLFLVGELGVRSLGIFRCQSHLRRRSKIGIGGIGAVRVDGGSKGGVGITAKELGGGCGAFAFAPLVKEVGKGGQNEEGKSPENAAYDSADVCGFRRGAHLSSRRRRRGSSVANLIICGSGNPGSYDGCSSGRNAKFDPVAGN